MSIKGGRILINAQYKKDFHGHYLIISNEKENLSYGLKMLLNNEIKGLLKLELHIIDDTNQYYYDITSKLSFSHAFDKSLLNYEQIKKIVKGIIDVIEFGKEYLLPENDFVLDPDYLYVDLSSYDVSLCHLNGYQKDIIEQLSSTIEYLMNKVDYNDEESVLFIYGLYKISQEECCTFDKLINFIHKKNYNEEKIKNDQLRNELIIENKDVNNNNIPLMQERLQSEEEVLIYSKKTIVIAILSVLVFIGIFLIGYSMGLFHNHLEDKIDFIKLFGCILILSTIESYFLSQLFHKKNKITKLNNKIEYISNVIEIDTIREKEKYLENMEENDKIDVNIEEYKLKDINNYFNILGQVEDRTVLLDDYDFEKTTLLVNEETIYKLTSITPTEYKDIELIEFPFFIGKLDNEVTGSIKCNVISRFHAKIDQKGKEFYITDLNSTNGTFLNDDRLNGNETKELHINDEIKFANISYRFEII